MLQLYRLTNTDIVTLENENKELDNRIAYLNNILNSDEVLRKVIIDQLKGIKKKYPMPRLSKIRDEVQEIKIDEKAMILPVMDILSELVIVLSRLVKVFRSAKKKMTI